jgi:hypothetical protein
MLLAPAGCQCCLQLTLRVDLLVGAVCLLIPAWILRVQMWT